MNPGSADLERLISRFLDDEATPAERRTLRAQMRRDPAADALVEQYVTLDREVGRTVRQAMGRSPVMPIRLSWARLGRLAGLAAAACLAAMIWVYPHSQSKAPTQRQPQRASTSWFAPAGSDAVPTSGHRVQPRMPVQPAGPTQREWILVPGERPGEYMVIEVRRPRARPIVIHGDF